MAQGPGRGRRSGRRGIVRGKLTTTRSLAERLYGYATGWLGWSPDVALDTPMPLILLAIEGKADFVARTGPFGGGNPSGTAGSRPPPRAAPAAPEHRRKVARQSMQMFRMLAAARGNGSAPAEDRG